jgi:nucleoid DNA-binding protein
MNKKSVSDKLSIRLHISKEEVKTFVTEYHKLIEEELLKNSKVVLPTLGTIYYTRVCSRFGVDVNTGERIPLKETVRIVFRPLPGLKKRLKEHLHLI